MLFKSSNSIGTIHKNNWDVKTELHNWTITNDTKYKELKLKSPHFHDDYQIGFVTKGVIENKYKKSNELINTKRLYVIKPNEIHSENLVYESNLEFTFMFIPSSTIENIINDITGSSNKKDCFNNLLLDNKANSQQLKIAYDLFASFRQNDTLAFQTNLLNFVENELIISNEGNISAIKFGKEERVVEFVKMYLQEHYCNEVSLDELATGACMSKFHLARTFLKKTGMTIHRFQTNLRVCKAKELLVKGLNPVNVAMELGFSDQAHFSNTFKRFTSQTPSQFYLRK
ncbi:MAG: AraC family transcriptional regulator [bacterium]|nr:AraC family transcriptional regulator [bacterium]